MAEDKVEMNSYQSQLLAHERIRDRLREAELGRRAWEARAASGHRSLAFPPQIAVAFARIGRALTSPWVALRRRVAKR